MSKPRRSCDPGLSVQAWQNSTWVVCPRCRGPACSTLDAIEDRAQLVCRRCSYVAERRSEGARQEVGEATDGRFGLPLYLTVDVRGHRLWAYNLAHLDALAAWLGATLRERARDAAIRNRTMMARLPRWMTSAAARPQVLKALARMRDRASRAGLS